MAVQCKDASGYHSPDGNATSDCKTDFKFCYDKIEEHEKMENHKCLGDSSEMEAPNVPRPLPAKRRKLQKRQKIFSLKLPLKNEDACSATREFGGGDNDFPKKDGIQGFLPGKESGPIDGSSSSNLCKIKYLHKNSASKVVLLQDPAFSSPSNEPFTAKLELQNFSSIAQAFKIFCSSIALFHFTVRPRSGLVPARGSISLTVKTKSESKTGKPPSNEIMSGDRLIVKFFPAYFLSEDDYQKKYEKKEFEGMMRNFLTMLQDQSPELISSRVIRKVVLGDSTGQPYRPLLSSEDLRRIEINRSAHSTQMQILSENQNMRILSQKLRLFQNAQSICLFLGVCAFVIFQIMPYLEATEVVSRENQSCGSWIMAYFQSFVAKILSLFY